MDDLIVFGLKMNGLINASCETFDFYEGSGMYTNIYYDRSRGFVFTEFFPPWGEFRFHTFHDLDDPNVIKIFSTSKYIGIQKLAYMIYTRVHSLNSDT